MKKILLIGDSSLNDSPYIKSYIEIFEGNGISYDLVFWNKNLDDTSLLPDNYIPYNTYTHNKYPAWKKIYKIYFFYRFVKKIIKKNEYSSIVVFTIAHAVYFESYLNKFYKGSYIFDIRDNSPMCKVPFFRKKMESLIANSKYTVISSAGYLRWLPTMYRNKYVVAHNVTSEVLHKYLNSSDLPVKGSVLRILTIGAIRDFGPNSYIIEQLANDTRFQMQFSGSGNGLERLKDFTAQSKYNNVSFTGKYLKKDEVQIVEKNDMINIYLSRNQNSDTAMANRFYLSAMLRKPMIVNNESFQSEQVCKYGIGVMLAPNDNVKEVLMNYWNSLDVERYNEGCTKFLTDVLNEIEIFKNRVIECVKG